MLPLRARKPTGLATAVEFVRASGPARTHGVESRTIDGVVVHITSAAKTVADCFRYRRHIGLEVAIEALRDYVRTRKGSIGALEAAARADRIWSVLRPYLEALV